MIKKLFCVLPFLFMSVFSFADSLDDAVSKAIQKIIPTDNLLVEVETPYYDDTFAASKFSDYLKNTIESVLTDCGKNIFDSESNESIEEKIAEWSDLGYSKNKNAKLSLKKMPDGILSSNFSENNNEVIIVFSYLPLMGNKNSTKITYSTKNLPGLKYEPENYEQAKAMYADIKEAELIAARSPERTIRIKATMLDRKNKVVDVLYPDSIVHFKVESPERDAYISIKNISADNKNIWLIINQFIRAGESWESPAFKPIDNVFGAETIYIYAASSTDGLPVPDYGDEYVSGTLAATARGLMLDLSDDKTATGQFSLNYTILEK